MRICTSSEMKAIDEAADREYGLEAAILMENAGRSAAQIILEEFPTAGKETEILVFAGKGNNAGDGFVIARHLDLRGIAVPAVLRVQTVGQQDNRILVGVVGILRRRIQRVGLGQRHPRPRHADALVSVPGRLHVADQGFERAPVVAERHDRLQIRIVVRLAIFLVAGDIFFGREARRAVRRCGILGVVVLVAVGNATGPLVVALGRPGGTGAVTPPIPVARAVAGNGLLL